LFEVQYIIYLLFYLLLEFEKWLRGFFTLLGKVNSRRTKKKHKRSAQMKEDNENREENKEHKRTVA
jgi:hypothetical protein